MARKIVINGPAKLSGTVPVQGAKNSAMKHVLMPLLAPGVWTFHNIPRIGSITNLIEIVELQGVKANWTSANTLTIDSTSVTMPQTIPAHLFYYTSGAIFIITILASRFGQCTLEINQDRDDYGGCQLGSRDLQSVRDTLTACGISSIAEDNTIVFKKAKNTGFEFKVPKQSFGASVNSVLAALFKSDTSTISDPVSEPEFLDTIKFLQTAGQDIVQEGNIIKIKGNSPIKPIEYTNMHDRHDFITFLVAALATNSEITIENVNYEAMRLNALQSVVTQMGIDLSFKNNKCHIKAQLNNLKPINVIAGMYPKFLTEWQVLFAPLLSQINGQSEVVDSIYTNRMQHYRQLEKMGAKYEFFTHPEYPETNGNPRAVNVFGGTPLHGAEVVSDDVRAGASLLVAGLVAHGQTTIHNYDQIERGYENLVERFQKLGADISLQK